MRNAPFNQKLREVAIDLATPRGPGGAERQAEVLETEGVEAVQGRMGEYEVDMSVYGWRPNRLPNDSSDEEEDDEA